MADTTIRSTREVSKIAAVPGPPYLAGVGEDPWAAVGGCTIDVSDFMARHCYEREIAGL